jgi:2-dehydro-3-deoxy-D-arabinonate dehydratase
LSTGTCLVPELGFTLEAGDRVDIAIDQVGMLSNPVVRGSHLLSATAVP